MLMVEKCKAQPRLICLSGGTFKTPIRSSAIKSNSAILKRAGRLYEASGAPFGLLFELVDTLIIHGGLGTTAEALRAGIPAMVTGVLLMDQRFWGQQVNKLGVGPPPVHVTDFHKVCVGNLDNCLDPTHEWPKRAKELAKTIQCESADGVPENVAAIAAAAEKWKGRYVMTDNSKTNDNTDDKNNQPLKRI